MWKYRLRKGNTRKKSLYLCFSLCFSLWRLHTTWIKVQSVETWTKYRQLNERVTATHGQEDMVVIQAVEIQLGFLSKKTERGIECLKCATQPPYLLGAAVLFTTTVVRILKSTLIARSDLFWTIVCINSLSFYITRLYFKNGGGGFVRKLLASLVVPSIPISDISPSGVGLIAS